MGHLGAAQQIPFEEDETQHEGRAQEQRRRTGEPDAPERARDGPQRDAVEDVTAIRSPPQRTLLSLQPELQPLKQDRRDATGQQRGGAGGGPQHPLAILTEQPSDHDG